MAELSLAPIPPDNRAAQRLIKAFADFIVARRNSKDYGALVGETCSDSDAYEKADRPNLQPSTSGLGAPIGSISPASQARKGAAE